MTDDDQAACLVILLGILAILAIVGTVTWLVVR